MLLVSHTAVSQILATFSSPPAQLTILESSGDQSKLVTRSSCSARICMGSQVFNKKLASQGVQTIRHWRIPLHPKLSPGYPFLMRLTADHHARTLHSKPRLHDYQELLMLLMGIGLDHTHGLCRAKAGLMRCGISNLILASA